MAPNVLTIKMYRLTHLDPIEKRFFVAGAESAYTMVGYMDGAVEAGERNARNALVSLEMLSEEFYDVVSDPPPSPQLPRNTLELSVWEKSVPNPRLFLSTGKYAATLLLGIVGTLAFLRCV